MNRCDLLLDEHAAGVDCGDDGHRGAIARRRDSGKQWSLIERRVDHPWRDFLDGQPIHCGARLELQAVDEKYDDYGGWQIHLQAGELVRYEVAWGVGPPYDETGRRAILHHRVGGGYDFTAPLEAQWMRFRWPAQ